MSILTWIEEKKRLKLLNAPKYVNPDSDRTDLLSDGAPRGGRSSKGLWTRCDKCGVILYIKHLKENQRVCFGCTYHLQMSSQERIENLLDKESWRPFDETVSPCDPLEFHDQRDYTDRLRDAQDKTGLQDAIQTGTGFVDGIPVALGIMDFDFMGGSMGSVVGEKITRLIEYATQEGLTLLLVCASGGARMQEGVFSLMQMAKISSALQIYQSCANLLYISILTSPTTGGVTASFAMLGDIIFAEPKALIAFAGRRVIEQTLCEDLPEDFQTSEYMLHHGLVDLIVPRRFLRQALSESIRLYKNAPFKKPGRIPFGVQNPISFITEEKLRRQSLLAFSELELESLKEKPNPTNLGEQTNLSPNSPLTTEIKSYTVASPEVLLAPSERTIDSTNKSKELLDKDGPNKTEDLSLRERTSLSTRNSQKAGAIKHAATEASDFSERSDLDMDNASVLKGPIHNNPKGETISRQSVGYREILTSFKMMYHLFSKQKAASLIKDTNTIPVGSIGEQNTIKPAETMSDAEALQKSTQGANLKYNQPPNQRNVGYNFPEVGQLHEAELSDQTADEEALLSLSQNLNKNSVEITAKTTTDASLLQKFRELAQGVAKQQQFWVTRANLELPQGITQLGVQELSLKKTASNGIEGPKDKRSSKPGGITAPIMVESDMTKLKVKAPSNKDIVPSLLSSNNNTDFLNQALELAATESIEWRAFYVHQTISKTTGFLEDFLTPGQYTGLLGSTHKLSTSPAQLQNTLFYKSICRTTIG